MATTSQGLWPKFQCAVGRIEQFNIITWAQNAEAACRQVAAFEDVPLAWVSAIEIGADK